MAGLSQSYIYAGRSHNEEVKFSRLIYRDQHRKTRVVGGWEASLNDKVFFGLWGDTATLESTPWPTGRGQGPLVRWRRRSRPLAKALPA